MKIIITEQQLNKTSNKLISQLVGDMIRRPTYGAVYYTDEDDNNTYFVNWYNENELIVSVNLWNKVRNIMGLDPEELENVFRSWIKKHLDLDPKYIKITVG